MVKSYELVGFDGVFEKDEIKEEFLPLFENRHERHETINHSEDGEKEAVIDIESQARQIFEDAYVQGEKAGIEMGMRKVEPLVKRLNTYLEEIGQFKKVLVKEAERLAFELAFLFAEAIVLKKCNEDKEVVLNMITKALEICEVKNSITIRVRRDDIKYLDQDRLKHLNIVPDDTIMEPGFVIETNFGDIDGMVETQIEELKKGVFL